MDLAIIDFIMIGLMALSVIVGIWRGFFRELFSLATWVAALFLSLHYANDIMPFFERFISNEKGQYAAALVLVFVGVWIIGSLIGFLLAKALRSVGLGFFDRLFGMIFGAGRGVILIVILLLVVQSTVLQTHDWAKGSVLADHFKPLVSYFEAMVPVKYAALMSWLKGFSAA